MSNPYNQPNADNGNVPPAPPYGVPQSDSYGNGGQPYAAPAYGTPAYGEQAPAAVPSSPYDAPAYGNGQPSHVVPPAPASPYAAPLTSGNPYAPQQTASQPYGAAPYGAPQQAYGYGAPQQPGKEPGKGKAIASLVLGIVACVGCVFGWLSLIAIACGIVGIIMSIMSKNAGYNGGMRTAGLVCSIIGLALSGIGFLACVACASSATSIFSSI